MKKLLSYTKNRIKTILLPCLLLAITLLLYGPVESNVNAKGALLMSLSDTFNFFLPIMLICLVALLLIGLLLNDKVAKVFACIVFSLGFASYLQGNYINADYGVLDGSQIIWESYKSYALTNSLIWIAILLVPLILFIWKKEKVLKIISAASGFVIAMQVVAVCIMIITAPGAGKPSGDPQEPLQLGLSREGLYTLCEEENTLILIADSFDAQYMEYLLENESEYLEELEGFTYYRNTACMYPKTQGAVPYILTGIGYHNEVPYADYASEVYGQSAFLREFRDAGYDMRIFTSIDQEYISPYVENVSDGKFTAVSSTKLGQLVAKYVGFRYAPHHLKHHFWLDTADFSKLIDQTDDATTYMLNDVELYNGLLKTPLATMDARKGFRVIHFYGIHEPFTLTSKVEYTTDGSQDLFENIRGCMTIINEYLKQLKASGKYDDATILVLGDHGGTQLGQPAFLLKKPNSGTQPLEISEKPVSFADIHATLLSYAELDASVVSNGRQIDDISEHDNVSRVRNDYTIHSKAEDGYLPSMWEMVYGLDNTDPDYTGRVFVKGQSVRIEDIAAELDYGQVVVNEELKKYSSPGLMSWGTDEYIWGTGKSGILAFKLKDRPSEGINVTLEWISWKIREQRLTVLCEDKVLFDDSFTLAPDQTGATFYVPADCIRADGTVILRLKFPQAASGLQMGTSSDTRLLNFGFKSLVVDKA